MVVSLQEAHLLLTHHFKVALLEQQLAPINPPSKTKYNSTKIISQIGTTKPIHCTITIHVCVDHSSSYVQTHTHRCVAKYTYKTIRAHVRMHARTPLELTSNCWWPWRATLTAEFLSDPPLRRLGRDLRSLLGKLPMLKPSGHDNVIREDLLDTVRQRSPELEELMFASGFSKITFCIVN